MRTPVSLAAGLAMSLAPVPVLAQPTGWLDLFDPNLWIERGLQYGIMAARTQVDLTYSALTVDALAGRAVLTDLVVLPLPEWDDEGACSVSIDRIVLDTAPAGDVENLKLRASIYGLSTHRACFPPDVWPVFALLGQETPSVPHATLSIDYHFPTGAAGVDLHLVADDLLAADLTAEFDYLWIDARGDIEEPEPVAFLTAASLSVENLGIWDRLSNILPTGFKDPATAPAQVAGLLTQMMQGGTDSAPALRPAQAAFVASAQDAWAAFVSDPKRLVVETGIDPAAPAYLDFAAWENDPWAAMDAINPAVAVAPSALQDMVPVALLRAALSSEDNSLSPEDKFRVGRALVTGVGAPRSVNAGARMLFELAQGGSTVAAATLSEALENRDPRAAYGWAVVAASAGQAGAAARMDRLERVLPFAEVLAVQAEVHGDQSHPRAPLGSIATVKAEARARLTGQGKPRSYEIAAMWAMIASASGESEGAAILQEIDQKVAASGTEAQEVWARAESKASELAMRIWITEDLPTRYTGD